MDTKGEDETDGGGDCFASIAIFHPGDGGSVVGVAEKVRMGLKATVYWG